MTGLLLKEYLQLRDSKLSWLLWIFWLVIPVAIGKLGYSRELGFIMCASLAFGGGLMTADVRCRWNRYAAALPVSRAEIVKSKYVVSAVLEGIVYIILLTMFILRAHTAEGGMYSLSGIGFLIAYSIAADTISLFIVLKAGVRKGQPVSLGVNLALAVLAALFMESEHNIGYMQLISLAAIMFAVILRIASLPAAIRIYEKRDL